MPRKTRYRRRRSTLARRMSRKVGGSNLIRRMPSSGIPNSVYIRHKYVYVVNATTTTTPNTSILSLSSMYDPDVLGVGTQPHYFDQLSALYNKYCVYGVKVIMKACAGGNQAILGFKQQPDTTTVTNAVSATERPNVKWALVNSGASPVYMSKYFSLPHLWGLSKRQYLAEDDYAAAYTTNPAKNMYLQVFTQHPDLSSTSSVNVTVELIYYARWNERIRQGGS